MVDYGLGPDFYNDFYYPVGGLDRFIRTTTPQNFRRKTIEASKDIPIVLSIMQIFDFHAKHLGIDPNQYKKSNSKGTELARDIHGIMRNEICKDIKKIDDVWKNSNSTAALLYAASTIRVTSEKSLLDRIRQGKSNFEKHGHLLKIWVARARYAAETILGNHTLPEISEKNLSQLPSLLSEPTPEPIFSAKEQTRIRDEFDKAKILKNRRPNERRERSSRRGPRGA